MQKDLGFLMKRTTISKKKKSKDQVENLVNEMLSEFYEESKRVIAEAMQIVNSTEYREKKMAQEREAAIRECRKPRMLTQDKYEFLDVMDQEQLNITLLSLLPIIKIEKEKYMIGTECKKIQIKSDRLFIRVGGGYATLEEFIKQHGPFECIKIYKVMRDKKIDFPNAVKFYLEKHKTANNIIKDYMKNSDSS